MAVETKTPPQPIYRIGRRPDAWRPPDWSRASADGTFGNRFMTRKANTVFFTPPARKSPVSLKPWPDIARI
jgi:hypothetical protein